MVTPSAPLNNEGIDESPGKANANAHTRLGVRVHAFRHRVVEKPI